MPMRRLMRMGGFQVGDGLVFTHSYPLGEGDHIQPGEVAQVKQIFDTRDMLIELVNTHETLLRFFGSNTLMLCVDECDDVLVCFTKVANGNHSTEEQKLA